MAHVCRLARLTQRARLTRLVRLTRRQRRRLIHPARLIQQGLCLRIAQLAPQLSLMERVYRADQASSLAHLLRFIQVMHLLRRQQRRLMDILATDHMVHQIICQFASNPNYLVKNSTCFPLGGRFFCALNRQFSKAFAALRVRL